MSNKGNGAVQRDLKVLDEVGIIMKSPLCNRIYYQLNTGYYLYKDIKSLIKKLDG